MELERRPLGLTGIELPAFGLRAGRSFDVIGKEAQASRSHLLRTALERDIEFFTTSPEHGDAQRILAAGLIGYRHRAIVMQTITNPGTAAAYREIDVALHLFDGRIEVLTATWEAATDDLLTSLVRMRSMGDAVAIGVVCQSVDDFAEASQQIVVEGFDLLAIPATLLISDDVNALLSKINTDQCGLIAFVPDGLDTVRGESLDVMKVNLAGHGLDSLQDVLAKLALSDRRLTSVAIPARRVRDLDRLARIASDPPFTTSEMDALRTG